MQQCIEAYCLCGGPRGFVANCVQFIGKGLFDMMCCLIVRASFPVQNFIRDAQSSPYFGLFCKR